jgi:hypothetical protein
LLESIHTNVFIRIKIVYNNMSAVRSLISKRCKLCMRKKSIQKITLPFFRRCSGASEAGQPSAEAPEAPEAPLEKGNALEYSKMNVQERVRLYDTIVGITVHQDVDLNSPYRKLPDEEIAKLDPGDAYFTTPRRDSWAAETLLAQGVELTELPDSNGDESVTHDESVLDNPPDRIKRLAHRILSQSIIEDAAMKKLLRDKLGIGDAPFEDMYGDGFPLEEGEFLPTCS